MQLETLVLSNFRCFAPDPVTIALAADITTLLGGNGSGKTAALAALARMFGVSRAQRSIQKADFHITADDDGLEDGAQITLEAVFAFPELEDDAGDELGAVAEFWRQMAATEDGDALKVRVQLRATWVDDGTPDGAVEEDMRWITRLDDEYDWDSCPKVSAADRGAVQVIYIAASRNVSDQVKALLRGRLWRAATWSPELKSILADNADVVQNQFEQERPIQFIRERIDQRWEQVHTGDTDTQAVLRLVENRFEVVVRQAEVKFQPDEAGLERDLDELSDGQKSLFQIALTAATLEVEKAAIASPTEDCPFDQAMLKRIPLTLLAIEEPENSLSPFFLSRIMSLADDIGAMDSAQVLLASHSPSILSRIKPEGIRYFRQDRESRSSSVRSLTMPPDTTEEGSYVRLAVRAYPELYFARFVVLAEGDSEQVVLPALAAAKGLFLDRSFVPIVPLGGRHVVHFWRLLNDLEIPHATLLDLDLGRAGGGADRIKEIVGQLQSVGKYLANTAVVALDDIDPDTLEDLADEDFDRDYEGETSFVGNEWLKALRELGVFYSEPIDLDFSMLLQFREAYKVPRPGGWGPSKKDSAAEKRKKTTLKKKGSCHIPRGSMAVS
jgi:putative ATP-dependent endonuclease of the OLD family